MKMTKISMNECGNVYNYRGFIIYKEYLNREGCKWLATYNNHRLIKTVEMKPNKELIMDNCLGGNTLYRSTLNELKQLIDEALTNDYVYISYTAWPFNFKSEKREMVMNEIIDKSNFK